MRPLSSNNRVTQSTHQQRVELQTPIIAVRPGFGDRHMVFFASVGGDTQVRIFLERLDQGHTSNESSVKVKVLASVNDKGAVRNNYAILTLS